MKPLEHQKLIRENISAAREARDFERAAFLEKLFAPLLAIKLEAGEEKPTKASASEAKAK